MGSPLHPQYTPENLTKTLQKLCVLDYFYITVGSSSNVKEMLATQHWLLARWIVCTEGFDSFPPLPEFLTLRLTLQSLPWSTLDIREAFSKNKPRHQTLHWHPCKSNILCVAAGVKLSPWQIASGDFPLLFQYHSSGCSEPHKTYSSTVGGKAPARFQRDRKIKNDKTRTSMSKQEAKQTKVERG